MPEQPPPRTGRPDSLELSRGRRFCSFGYSVSRSTPIDRATSTPIATSSAIISGLTPLASDVSRRSSKLLGWASVRRAASNAIAAETPSAAVPLPRLPAPAAAPLRTHPRKILRLRAEHHVRAT